MLLWWWPLAQHADRLHLGRSVYRLGPCQTLKVYHLVRILCSIHVCIQQIWGLHSRKRLWVTSTLHCKNKRCVFVCVWEDRYLYKWQIKGQTRNNCNLATMQKKQILGEDSLMTSFNPLPDEWTAVAHPEPTKLFLRLSPCCPLVHPCCPIPFCGSR